jgi:hypothetical protein
MSEEFLEYYNQLKSEKPEEPSIIDEILDENRQGFTEDEIEFFMRKSPAFRKYMKSEGAKLELKHAKYRVERISPVKNEDGTLNIDATSKMDGVRKGTKVKKDLRNNMFIDIVWNILTSPEGSKLSMQPGSFDNVKHASRMQRILHDKQALSKFMELYKDEIELCKYNMDVCVAKARAKKDLQYFLAYKDFYLEYLYYTTGKRYLSNLDGASRRLLLFVATLF